MTNNLKKVSSSVRFDLKAKILGIAFLLLLWSSTHEGKKDPFSMQFFILRYTRVILSDFIHRILFIFISFEVFSK